MGKTTHNNAKIMAARMVTLVDGKYQHADAVVKLEGETLKLLYYKEDEEREESSREVR